LAIYFAQTIRSFQPEFMLTVLSSILNSDFRDRLPSVVTPTLIIQSLNDVFVPLQVATYLNNQIVNSELSIINAQGHLPHISSHPAVVDAIKAFLHIPPTLTAPPAAAVRTSCSDSGTPQA
jgi:sigma-B regulation protein RsbQ